MYNIANLPTFTYAGAMKPKADYDRIVRNTLLVVSAVFLIAALVY